MCWFLCTYEVYVSLIENISDVSVPLWLLACLAWSVGVFQLICLCPFVFNIPLSQVVQVHQVHHVSLGSPSVHADLELQVHPWSQVHTVCTQVLQLDPWVLMVLAHLAALLVQHPLAVLHDITTVNMMTSMVEFFYIICWRPRILHSLKWELIFLVMETLWFRFEALDSLAKCLRFESTWIQWRFFHILPSSLTFYNTDFINVRKSEPP